MEKVEGAGGVVRKVDAVFRGDDTEECACPGEGAFGVIHELDGNLLARERFDLNGVAVVASGGDQVAVGCEGEAERIMGRPAGVRERACGGKGQQQDGVGAGEERVGVIHVVLLAERKRWISVERRRSRDVMAM